MKYFYSYYPTKIIDDESVLFNLLSIKLSSILLQKENKKIGIYCDSKTIELLNEYEIKLDFYENIENEIKNISSESLFSVCKLYSNSIQTEPFIQLDTDLFLFDIFNFELLESSDVSFFTIEDVNSYSPPDVYNGWVNTYLSAFNILSDRFPDITYKEYTNPLMAYNCAVVGGTNYKLFSELYNPILELIHNNKTYLETLGEHPMAVLEQHIITGHLTKLGYGVHDINFISGNRIPYIFKNNNKLLYQIDEFDNIVLSDSGKMIDSENKEKLQSLLWCKFHGSIHLQGAKGNIDIRQFIYYMLKVYDPTYINWLEQKIGIKYEFQGKPAVTKKLNLI